MLMKVHAKGQVVIPAEIRQQLGIEIGDVLEVDVDPEGGRIELRRPRRGRGDALAGSLREYAQGKRFPSRRVMTEALRKGMLGDG